MSVNNNYCSGHYRNSVRERVSNNYNLNEEGNYRSGRKNRFHRGNNQTGQLVARNSRDHQYRHYKPYEKKKNINTNNVYYIDDFIKGKILSSRNLNELNYVFFEYKNDFSNNNLSGTILRVFKFVNNEEDKNNTYVVLIDKIRELVMKKIDTFNGKSLTIALSTFAKLNALDQLLIEKCVSTAKKKLANNFRPKETGILIWELSKLKVRDDQLVNQVADYVYYHAKEYDSISLTNILQAFASFEKNDPRLMDTMAEQVCAKINDFSLFNISSVAQAYAVLGIKNKKLMQKITELVGNNINQLNPTMLVKIVHAFATLQYRDKKLMEKIANKTSSVIHMFESQDVLLIAKAFEKLRIKNESLMENIAKHFCRNIKEYNSEQLIEILSIYEKFRINNNDLMNEISKKIIQEIGSFDTQQLIFVAFTYASSKKPDKMLMEGISRKVQNDLGSCSCKEVLKLGWAFVKLKIHDKELIDKILDIALENINEYDSRDLSIIAWIQGAEQNYYEKLMSFISDRILEGIGFFTAEELLTITCSFARLGYQDKPDVLMKIAETIAQDVGKASSSDLSLIALLYAKSKIHHAGLLQAIANDVKLNTKKYSTEHFSDVAWSLAELNYKDALLYQAIVNRAETEFKSFHLDGLVDINWALAVNGFHSRILTQQMIDLYMNDNGMLDSIHFQRMSQVVLFYKFILKGKKLWSVSIQNKINDELNQPHFKYNTSEFFKSVTTELDDIDLSFRENVSVDGLVVDIMPENHSSLSVLVNDSSCYQYESTTPLGSTTFKEQLLKAIGYNVLTIPYWEWENVLYDGTTMKYLLSKGIIRVQFAK